MLVARWTLELVDALFDSVLLIQLDDSVLLVTPLLAVGVALATGLYPAVHISRAGSLAALRMQSGPAGGRRASRLRASLATAQVAASMVLLVLAGLFTSSLLRLTRADVGMQPEGVMTFTLAPARNGYDPERSVTLFNRVEQELGALPGVTSVVSSTTPLFENDNRSTSVRVKDVERGPDGDDALYDEIGPRYFRTLGVPLVAGREFAVDDSAGAPKVAIVNEAFARKFGFARKAVGKRISRGSRTYDIEIVGPCCRCEAQQPDGSRRADVFCAARPDRQAPRLPRVLSANLREGAETMSAVRQTVGRLDGRLPIEKLRTMNDALGGAMVQYRLMGTMIGAFAALATLVAGIGLYGVVAYAVAQRTSEIGLRMALGATRARVRWMVLRQVGAIAAVGGGIGLGLALLIGRAARSLLFGLEFHDAWVLAASLAALMLVAVAAGLVPASRAARVDPMRALKYE